MKDEPAYWYYADLFAIDYILFCLEAIYKAQERRKSKQAKHTKLNLNRPVVRVLRSVNRNR